MAFKAKRTRDLFLCATALAGLFDLQASAANAAEAAHEFSQPAQSLASALRAYSVAADEEIIFSDTLVTGRVAPGLEGRYTAEQALDMLLAGTELGVSRTPSGVLRIEADRPQLISADAGAASNVVFPRIKSFLQAPETLSGSAVEGLVVTAQKKREQIQDVPIAISAFSAEGLQAQKIEGGFDLLKAIPNVTFSKNNFTSFNFSIRGIGTKAVSATTDPGVAVAFNNTALIQNRLFEQEYFDIERVEVLRGPQGTLYGRNATAGVINVISNKADLDRFDGTLKGEVGNYHTKRLSGFVNVPLIENVLAVRFAGALTDRQGYDYNSVTENEVNGRNLWSGRLSIGFEPTEHIRADFLWERFNEDDNRSRTGKQLCHRDPGRTTVGDTSVVRDPDLPFDSVLKPALFSQGCKPGSLYDDAAFGTPNGLSLPFVFGMLFLGSECGPGCSVPFPIGQIASGESVTLLELKDPYGGLMQSRDLRTIASFKDPKYEATADIFELNLEVDLSDALTVVSQTAYNDDTVYSFQDFNRFNTVPVFRDTHQLFQNAAAGTPSFWTDLAPGGIFCDPQLGCSDTLAGFDISQASGRQFSQEIRLQSDFNGPLNFSVGANYTRFEALVDYYVFYNLISAYALMRPFNGGFTNQGPDRTKCFAGGFWLYNPPGPIDLEDPRSRCPYIDPNPIESINGEGHNYFRSKNPYKLKSAAAFGETYWQINDALKVTAGLRYTDDRKTFIPVPTQILMAQGVYAGGYVNRGYPEEPPIKQHWGEWTGRFGVDWKPDLSFTDETMLYAFYSHGYKGGGANPPTPGYASPEQSIQQMRDTGISEADITSMLQYLPIISLNGVEYGPTFKPEFVDAFEIGAKNSLLGGGLTLNANAFFYDYKDYQVSQIRDRSAINENFDASVWGTEFEAVFAPSPNLQLVANVGYLDTKIADGMKSIDIMNRTQSDPGWVVVKPWVQLPSNCIIPVGVAENWVATGQANFYALCGGWTGLITPIPVDPATGQPYDFRNYPEINGGAGFYDDLAGNKLPNAPHWTMNLGVQYSWDLLGGNWTATVRGDTYWQSQSWARVYNSDPYDKLHGWYNANLSLWIEKPEEDLRIEFYVKNIMDDTPITDSFLNSDDTALTTNIFVLDPRLIGLQITKGF